MTTKISVAGLGYVGLSLAVLLARHNTVVGLDLVAERIEQLRRGGSPIHDEDISRFLAEEDLDLSFTTDAEEAHTGADFVIIATPTNYDPVTNYFDTRSIEAVMRDVMRIAPDATMVV
ncbi:MAG TPA: 2-dehydropantoate 2-reductase N-terminal domain-containing protein, partial [Nocardioides sp.]